MMRKRGLIFSFFLGFAAFGVAVFLMLTLIGRDSLYTVPLRSMEPTIAKDSRISVQRIDDFSARSAKYGDIVIFKSPKAAQEIYVQRLMALPGDRIEVRSRRFFRNGEILSEPYVKHDRTSELPSAHEFSCLDNLSPIEVPSLHVFLMGDNRDNVVDSRCWGSIPFKNITGIVVAITEPE